MVLGLGSDGNFADPGHNNRVLAGSGVCNSLAMTGIERLMGRDKDGDVPGTISCSQWG